MSLFRTLPPPRNCLMSTFRISYFPASYHYDKNNLPVSGNNMPIWENNMPVLREKGRLIRVYFLTKKVAEIFA